MGPHLDAGYPGKWATAHEGKAAAVLRALWSAGNSYLEAGPWLEIKTNPEGSALTLRTAMNLIHLWVSADQAFGGEPAAA